MAKKPVTRRELLNRWKRLEEEDNDISVSCPDPSKLRQFHQHKEDWFSDTFNFLICLSKENHIWCGFWDLMGPLLETFYHYFKNELHDSPLKLLWRRISEEMRCCTQCIFQHHQALEMYYVEYESSTVGPLLDVMHSLDEDRVVQHLKEINARVAQGKYVAARDDTEVITVMFEVLMFPILLDDQSLFAEFQLFIEAVDSMHELALAGHQQYPGVYALLFFPSARVRSIGRRLAGCMGKLRWAADLEPLQPLLKKCINFLEKEVLPLTSETSRPRVQPESMSPWLGINALLGFLEPPAFEEGILEHYPIFFSMVLNNISDESLEFLHAVKCLRHLFEMLGCKLWLRSTLSPSVMRNTLLGQCFHTQSEKSHKEIFDLFQPFLQSLEALQDGEHEEQRRHFLYFLLHQVTVSSNFSILMRKKACQIALLIIHRGYMMNPPYPPFECAHMWGPSLVSSLRDSSLHSSLRQPAFDLIQTIIVSDAAALISPMLNCVTSLSVNGSAFIELDDEKDDAVHLFGGEIEEDASSWSEFSAQSEITSLEYRGWVCIPMLWFEVLVEIDPSLLPISFWKAVCWARSRFSMVEPENGSEMTASVRDWLSSSATEISASFGWKVPTGSNDGGNGKESKNSIKLSAMHIILVRTFKRLTAHFLLQVKQKGLWKLWTWEPRMSECLILSLLDPNDIVRHVGRCILEQVSNSRGLACGLQLLCSSASSLSAIFLGLRHALKLVQLDSELINFQALHHFFFFHFKLLKEGLPSLPGNSSSSLNTSNFCLQGGFLRQPVVDSLPATVNKHHSNLDLQSWKFGCLLAETAWPFVRKCLVEGKAFVEYQYSQMTCIRILEILPTIVEWLLPSSYKLSGKSGMTVEHVFDFDWLDDLVDWGRSPLEVTVRYWKITIISLLDLFKKSWIDKFSAIIKAIEKLISCDSIAIDELAKQVYQLSVSLSNEGSLNPGKSVLNSYVFNSDGLFERKYSAPHVQPCSLEDADVLILEPAAVTCKHNSDNVIFLSDDEVDKERSPELSLSHTKSKPSRLDANTLVPGVDKKASQVDLAKKKVSEKGVSETVAKDFQQSCLMNSEKLRPTTSRGKLVTASLFTSDGLDSKKTQLNSECSVNDNASQSRANLTSGETVSSKSIDQKSSKIVSEASESLIKEFVHDAEDNPWERALLSEKRPQFHLTKPSPSAPRRQVIQLQLPGQNKSGYSRRLDAGVKRFKSPNLDDWYKLILEIDYFVTVGLSSANEGENQTASQLKEVPLFFESSNQYMNIFRPLVLEEFKAQLQSSFQEMSSLEDVHSGSVSVLSVERIDDFHLVRCLHDESDSTASRQCSENDLVLLTKQPLRNSSHDFHLVGKVERYEKDIRRRLNILIIRFYLQNGSSRLNRARKLIVERSKWFVSRVMSITPQLREFQALSSVNCIPILPIILKPDIMSPGCNESQEIDLSKLSLDLQQKLKSSFNDSQLQAISVAIGSPDSKRKFELSLIQGPPGTGKTRTVVAIVSGLLASSLWRTNETKKVSNDHSITSGSLRTNLNSKISQHAAIARAWQDAALARQLNENVEKNSNSPGSSARGRVLICAQSNAAVDELVARISTEGLYGSDGKMFKPYLVRVGNAKTVHPNSLPFFIDTLVNQRLAEERMDLSGAKNDMCGDSSVALRSNLEKLVDRIRFYETKRANMRDKNSNSNGALGDMAPKGDHGKEMSDEEIESKLRKLYEQKNDICKGLASVQVREKKAHEENRALKHKLRKSILREAEIVVTTLSGCGGDLYGVCAESFSSHKFGNTSENTLFDAVVIDEAAQALEPASLIPLQLLKSNGTKCIMLPATVLSTVASKFMYQCSLFERLQRAGFPVIMLSKQYRMHPEICRFPSMHFYDGKLLNGNQMSSKSARFHDSRCLGPYVFFDVIDGQELRGKNSASLSLYNEHEADAIVEILRFFRKRYPPEFVGKRIGIITPYKCQLSLLRSRVSDAFGPLLTADMEFNTVDGFQGREVDILMLSTVRAANPSSAATGITPSNIGFVADVRRMNVALTRAKISLWILGNARALQTNQNWAALVQDAKERHLLVSVKMPYKSMFESAVRKNADSENSDSHSGQQKQLKKVKNPSEPGHQNKCIVKEIHGVKRKYYSCEPKINKVVSEDEHCLSAAREDVQRKKRRNIDKPNSSEEDISSLVAAGKEVRMPKRGNPSIAGENVRLGEKKGRENVEKKAHWDKEKVSKGTSSSNLNHAEQDSGNTHKILKSQALKGPKKCYMHDRNQKNVEVPRSSSEGLPQERGGNGFRAPNQVETTNDLIASRKKQREAIDALLSSALISSKKPETSVKPVSSKRPFSST